MELPSSNVITPPPVMESWLFFAFHLSILTMNAARWFAIAGPTASQQNGSRKEGRPANCWLPDLAVASYQIYWNCARSRTTYQHPTCLETHWDLACCCSNVRSKMSSLLRSQRQFNSHQILNFTAVVVCICNAHPKTLGPKTPAVVFGQTDPVD